jgi:predicted nucleic acid-binding protein
MRVLFDTNVVLDVLFERHPWFRDSQALWAAHLGGRITAYLAASTITDIFYIARRATGRQQAWVAVDRCIRTFAMLGIDQRTLAYAMSLPRVDFEDNILVACASLHGLDAIVTRDTTGFEHSPIITHTPAELLTLLDVPR